jgi:branched-chain amino acid transport system permease protein
MCTWSTAWPSRSASLAPPLVTRTPIFKLDPMMGEQPLLKAFIIIILGGLGSIPGAILGGLMLGLIDSIVATALGAEPAFLLSFVFIIGLLLFRPSGLFGHA